MRESVNSRELDAERQIRGQRGAITALAIVALVFLVLLWSPLLLTGDARIDQANVVLALPVETLILTIGAVACALATFSAGLRRQIAWAGALGVIALAAVTAIVYFFTVLEKVSAAPLSDALVALMIFLGTATPPVAALVYSVMSRSADLQEEDVFAPTATPA
jgi:peptidoglycan/LPS O-acetylase OafA/YrhL